MKKIERKKRKNTQRIINFDRLNCALILTLKQPADSNFGFQSQIDRLINTFSVLLEFPLDKMSIWYFMVRTHIDASWWLRAIKLYWFSFSVWFILLSKFCATKFDSRPLELTLDQFDPFLGSKKVKEKSEWENVIIFTIGPMCYVAFIVIRAIQYKLLYRTRCCAYIVSHMWVQAIFIAP